MKLNRLFSLAVASVLTLSAHAQTTTQIGFGTGTGIGPFNGTVYPLPHTQRIIHFTQSEMANAGMFPGTHINSVKWYKSNTAQYTIPNAAMAILYMRNLTPALANGYGNSLHEVDSLLANVTYVPVDTIYYDNDTNAIDNNNWTGFSGFDFEFTGEELEMYVDYQVVGSVSGLNDGIEWKMFTADANVMHMLTSSTQVNFAPMAARPNTQFVYSGSSSTVSPNVVEGGQAVDDVSNAVAAGTVVNFDLGGTFSNVPGLTTYTWQAATTVNGPWANISNVLSSPGFPYAVPTSTMYYRAIVECGGNIDSSTHTLVVVLGSECQFLDAGMAFSNITTTMCPGDIFELDITNDVSASTFTWEYAPTQNGPWSTYSVPLPQAIIGIAAPNFTTWYRARVECSTNVDYTNEVEILISPGVSGNFTIDDAIPTGGTNFQSFADAIASLNCGISGPVVFDVVPGSGPYNEQVTVPSIPTTATNTVTFNGNGATVSYTSDDANERAAIKIDGASYITFRNLKIEAAGDVLHDYACGVQLLHDADNNHIDSCDITITEADPANSTEEYAGIVLNGGSSSLTDVTNANCDNNIISNNRIRNGYNAIMVLGDENSPVSGNQVVSNSVEDFYLIGISVTNNSGMVAERNDLSRPTRTSFGNFTGIALVNVSNAMVNANRIHDPAAADQNAEWANTGISVQVSSPATANKNSISNNLIYNFKGNSVSMGIMLNSVKNLDIYHNTISFEHIDAPACLGCRGGYGIYQYDIAATKLDIKNNIVSMNGTGDRPKEVLHFEQLPLNSDFDNNNYHFTNGVTNAGIGFMDGDDFETLADWQQAVFGEQNSLTLNPMYEDAANGNFKPAKDSLDNKGVYVNIDNDIVGAVRSSSTPDIGAYEFEVYTTGLTKSQIKESSISIYPNPAIDFINIISSEKVGVTVASIDGKVLLETRNVSRIDVSSLSPGFFLLTV